MRSDVQCLSWWVRRLPDCTPAGFFFRDVLRLPLIGQRGYGWDDNGSLFILWGGECIEFEFMPGGVERVPATKPEDQAQIPVFRSYAYDATLASIRASGATVLKEEGRTAWFLDPSGSVNALREPDPASVDPIDVEAARRHAAGGRELSGYKLMPVGIADLGWVQLHCVDVPAQLAFYHEVLELDVLADHGADGAVLSLGDTARLELRPGGRREEIPTDRAEVADMWMLRVRDMDAITHDLKTAGVHFVNDPWLLTGGVLAYAVDPEGHLFGIQDHPDDGRPQEQLAWKRWQDR